MNTTSLDSKSIADFCENLLNEENCNLFELEKRTIQYVHRLTAKALKIALERQDDKLFESKPEELKVVSKEKRTLATEVGDVSFYRRRYIDKYGNFEYLLADEMDIPYKTRISPSAMEFIVDMSSNLSYAKTSVALQRYGSRVSPKTIMRSVHIVGNLCRSEDEKEARNLYENGVLPDAEFDEQTINIESDGTYVSLQNGKKAEISALVAYSGKSSNNGRKSLNHPVHFGMVGCMDEFWTQGFAKIGHQFSLDKVKQINMGFDGEAKYKNGMKYSPVSARVTGQLDKFHLNRAISACLPNERAARTQILDCMYEGMPEEGADLLKEYTMSNGNYSETTERVIGYIKRNSEYINCGYISLGSMESDQLHSYKARFAMAPCGWSRGGVDAMARIRSRKSSKHDLPKYTREKSMYAGLSEKRENNIAKYLDNVERVYQTSSGKGYEYPTRISSNNLPTAVKFSIGYWGRKSHE